MFNILSIIIIVFLNNGSISVIHTNARFRDTIGCNNAKPVIAALYKRKPTIDFSKIHDIKIVCSTGDVMT